MGRSGAPTTKLHERGTNPRQSAEHDVAIQLFKLLAGFFRAKALRMTTI
ncbi:MAG: hypothetical protein NC191_08545 [Muribaculaceae bacterium]|nr:hypothetical protein [Muribaculaceae bacterium]